MFQNLFTETIAALIGIFVGTLAALAVDRGRERRRKDKRAKVILRSLAQELNENHNTLQSVRSAYIATPFGKSFYVNTVAWETAMYSGDLPDILGDDLTDALTDQYALLVRIRYYVDLLTRLWFAPTSIAGYEEIRRGFNTAIIETMNHAINNHDPLMSRISRILK
jgi:seryl-tRNA(Sec) selenium transferase